MIPSEAIGLVIAVAFAAAVYKFIDWAEGTAAKRIEEEEKFLASNVIVTPDEHGEMISIIQEKTNEQPK